MDERSAKTAYTYCVRTSYAAHPLGLSAGTIPALVEKGELEAWKTKVGIDVSRWLSYALTRINTV